MPKTALILIDIQNDYFEGGLWTLPEMDRAAANAARLLSAARQAGKLVIHIRHEMASEAAPFFRPGSAGAQIHASVAPGNDERVITKARPNSFHNTPLLDVLRETGVEAVTLCGAMSQMCVDATARAAADFGFAVTVVGDACAARAASFGGVEVDASAVHAAFMAPLAMSYGKVVTTAEHLAA
ncbi:cysteine hydrolase family protein [Hoeflea olei]|uniref:Isochorismatase n=1 Tax=Hoeflea olei TaxID=1480615 RepID=A0A1C1YY17_9HYPH|nr:cysteine hydrolase family protein [Hoeflea olei]OCW58444.1 Isochorismatase [Hoeflea olei]